MKKINFPPHVHSQITNLVDRIKKGDPNPFITFIFDKLLYVIGGPTEHLLMVAINDIDEDMSDIKGWSMSATAIANFWKAQHVHRKGKETISLEISFKQDQPYPSLEGITKLGSFRYIKAQEANHVHLAFFKQFTTNPYLQIATTKAKQICALAKQNEPYQVFEANKKTNSVLIERDNIPIPIPLPESMTIDHTMIMTPEATNDLQQLAETTSQETLSIYLNDEQAIFTDGEQVYSHSLAPLRTYREKKQQQFEQEAKIIIEIFSFKDELRNFEKIEEIKKSNQVLLYITPRKVYLMSLLQEVGAVMPLNVILVSTKQEMLYSVDLNALLKVKIKDITAANSIKLTVQRSTSGENKLSFHNDRNKEHSYHSIPLEKVSSLLTKVKDRLARAKEIDSPQSNLQQDIFGFDDV